MLRSHRTNAPKQQPSSIKRSIDWNDPICRHTDVDEPDEIHEEVHEENAEQEEHGDHEELEKEVLPQGQKRKKLKVRKGPTTRSHASLEQQFEDVWVPSSNEDPDPADLKEEQDDGVVP